MPSFMSRRLAGSLALFTAASCWGGTYVSSKYVLDFYGPFALVLIRYVLASMVFIPIYLLGRRQQVTRRQLGLLALTGFIGLGVSSWTQFGGTALSSAHAGALITSSAPAFMVMFGALLLHERITRRKVLAVAIASAGVALVVGPGDMGAGRLAVIGDLLLVVAGITWAIHSVLIRALTQRLASLTVTAYVTAFGVLYSVPAGIPDVIRAHELSGVLAVGILYIGFVSTALAYYLWNKGLELVEAGTASVFFFAQPLTGTFFAWLLLGERVNAGFFAGGALILAGVGIAVGRERAENPMEERELLEQERELVRSEMPPV